MKISIRAHNQVFLNKMAAQMECSPSIALDYLLFELRKMNYSFGSTFSISKPEVIVSDLEENIKPSDPVIERLLSLGLESF